MGTPLRLRAHPATVMMMCGALVLLSGRICGQTSPRPTSPGGVNSVDSLNGRYRFTFNGRVLYWYRPANDTIWDGTGATLGAIRAYTYDNDSTFCPSWTGGPTVEFCPGVEKWPTDPGVSFSMRSPSTRTGDTVVTRWRMQYRGPDCSERSYFDYQYRLHISGRTLVVRVEALGGSRGNAMATGFVVDRCEFARGPSVVRVPSLTLFNLLCSNLSYTSAFFDWEVTNCSRYTPHRQSDSVHRNSVRFGPMVAYLETTSGQRHPLKETIYITVSPDLEGALPNVPGPTAPMRRRAISRNVLSYDILYPWATEPSNCDPHLGYNFLDSLHRSGVTDLAVILKVWQRLGFDRGFPNVLPANPFDEPRQCNWTCANIHEPADERGSRRLRSARDYIVNELGFQVGLHENYVDYYEGALSTRWPDQYSYTASHCALAPDGMPMPGWYNSDCDITSFVLKPRLAREYLDHWAGRIARAISPTWSYLDVHSSINPSDRVDYDPASGDSAAMFLFTLQKYRELPGVVRQAYGGPVQGEGGNHFLYAGYFDDFEARIQTADVNVYGHKAPLLVDFDLLKLRPKSALHGAGHYFNFYADNVGGVNKTPLDRGHMLQFVATELAYGRGGLATKDAAVDHAIEQSIVEQQHVLPVYRLVADAHPLHIQYGDSLVDASTYIRSSPDYADSGSPHFMSKVKVVYDNGVVVYVNRSTEVWRNVDAAGAWFSYHILVNGIDSLGVGLRPVQAGFDLPAANGWLVASPSRF